MMTISVDIMTALMQRQVSFIVFIASIPYSF